MNRILVFIAVIAASSSMLVGCKPSTSPSGGTAAQKISGVVTDANTGYPVPGAIVYLVTSDTMILKTDTVGASGVYAFTLVASGIYEIAAVQTNYETAFDSVHVVPGTDVQLDLALTPQQQHQSTGIWFHVESAVTGQGLANAMMASDGYPPSAVGFNGDVFYGAAQTGPHSFVFSAPGFTSLATTVSLIQNVTIIDTIRLFPHFDTLLCQYMFNGTAIDSSGKGHDGTLHGGTFTFDRFGIANSAIQFNGTTDYISIPSTDDLNFGQSKSFSLCFWARCRNQNGQNIRYVLRKEDSSSGTFIGYNVGITDYQFTSYYGTTAGTTTMPGEEIGIDSAWHFFVYTFDGTGAVSLYYDGQINPYYTNTDITLTHAFRGLTPNASPLMIGGDGGKLHVFKGTLDDIRIYQGALLPSEVDTLYHLNGW